MPVRSVRAQVVSKLIFRDSVALRESLTLHACEPSRFQQQGH